MPLPCLFLVGTFTTDWGLVQKPLVGAACSQRLHWLHQARLWFLEAVNPSWSWPFSGQTHTRGRAQSDFCRIWSPLSPDDPSKAAVMIWNDPKWRPCLPRKSKIFSSSFSPMPASAAAQASLLCVCCLPRALTEAHTTPWGCLALTFTFVTCLEHQLPLLMRSLPGTMQNSKEHFPWCCL